MRINILLPEELVDNIKNRIAPRSLGKFLTEAAREKLEKLERAEALETLMREPASFTALGDSAEHIRASRKKNSKRLRRISP